MADQITINFENPIPLFPLPGAVLLPQTPMPLHIFEDRYKQMVNDVLDTFGLIAMALYRDDVTAEPPKTGRPPLRTNVCVGYTIQHERLTDGRYLILLQGLCRAQIQHEVDEIGTPYRLAQLKPTELPLMPDEDLADQRSTLRHFMANPLLREHDELQDIVRLLDEPVPTAALIDVGIGSVTEDVEQRYAMLAETDARVRAEFLEHRLEELQQHLSDETWG